MASTHVYDALKGELQIEFTPMRVIDVDLIDNILAQGEDAFLVIEEITESEDTIGFGDPTNLCQRGEGVMVVHAFVPSPESSAAVRTLGESVQTHMRHRTMSGVRITNAGPPDIELLNEGLWSVAAVALTYQHDFHVATP